MFSFLFALFMAFATPNHTDHKKCDNGTVTTFGDPGSDPGGDTGGETGQVPPKK